MDSQKLYAILDPATGHVKIGRSVDPYKRVQQLQITESRSNLRVLIVQDAASAADSELALHQLFADYRIVGEWFGLTPQMVDELQATFDAMRTYGDPSNVFIPAPAKPCRTKWKLKTLLDQHDISVYRLSKETKGRLSIQSLYNLVGDPPPSRIELASLDAIVEALRKLTGKDVKVCDLLEYE